MREAKENAVTVTVKRFRTRHDIDRSIDRCDVDQQRPMRLVNNG